MSVRYESQGTVAVITLDNPPVNGLGHATRAGVVSGIERANADPAIDIIVLTGAGKAFSGGADIREFNTPKSTAEPTLSAVIRTVEASRKAGRRSHRRRVHGRRPRAGAGLPLSRRAPGRGHRAARGEARDPAWRGRHAAAAARRRRREGAADDRERGERPRGGVARHPAFRCDRRRRPHGRRARLRAQGRRGKAAGDERARHRHRLSRRREAHSVGARKGGGRSQESACAATVHRRRGGGRDHAVRRRPRFRTHGRSSSSWSRPNRARCAMPFSRSAPRREFPTCPKRRRCERSRPSASSAPARWAPALR